MDGVICVYRVGHVRTLTARRRRNYSGGYSISPSGAEELASYGHTCTLRQYAIALLQTLDEEDAFLPSQIPHHLSPAYFRSQWRCCPLSPNLLHEHQCLT